MSTIKINIGLKSNKDGRIIEAGLALKQLFAYLAEPITSLCTLKIAQSDTESTLVVSVETDLSGIFLADRLHALAYSLEQDCIVFKYVGEEGSLLAGPGPKSKDWSDFDNSKFID